LTKNPPPAPSNAPNGAPTSPFPPRSGLKFRSPRDVRNAKREFQIKFDRALNAHLDEPVDVLKSLLEDGIDLPAITKVAIRVIVKAVETGNPGYIDMLLEPNIRKLAKGGKRKDGPAPPPPPPVLPDPELPSAA